MAEWLMQVRRTVTLAIKADCRADAEEAAFAQAWEWQPESAAGGDQGSVSVRVMPGHTAPGTGGRRCLS